MILRKKRFFEKNAVFEPKLAQNAHKMGPNGVHWGVQRGNFGFSYKMTFLRPSDQFSLGSQWFWYLQNDKMNTLGPTESPNGVRKGPRRAKNVPQNPTGPLQAYFSLFWGGQTRNFSKSFWAKKGQKIFPKKILFALFRLPKALGPSKTQN